MSPRGGTCPKCGSNSVQKERILGADTMDLICTQCNYSGHPSDFSELKSDKEESQDKKE